MNHLLAWLFLGLLAILPVGAAAASDAIFLSVDPQRQGASIPRQTLGLSYETSILLPDKKGLHYFRPDNQPLLTIFKTLGIRSLRIGGNSVDSPKNAIPTEQDVVSFFDFAKAAGVKVIYSVRLQNGDPASAARFARLIRDRYAEELDCFAIGNEPFYYSYDAFRAKWKAIEGAVLAVYPEAKFCGPDQNPDPVWFKKMVEDFGSDGHFEMLTEHLYPFGCAFKNPQDRKNVASLVYYDFIPSCEKMLAPSAYPDYEKARQAMADAVAGTSLSFRLAETNSYWFSGLQGASDRYASALWALDYLHWWAAHGAAGLNFHTGDVTGGAPALPCRYAAFVSAADGYEARPLSYGLKMFDLGGYGRQIPLKLSSPPGINIVAYAGFDEHQTLFVTVINKTIGTTTKNTKVVLHVETPSVLSDAEAIFLRADPSDLTAESGITVGDAAIQRDGGWNGRWRPLEIASDHTITTDLPPLSAVVIRAHIP